MAARLLWVFIPIFGVTGAFLIAMSWGAIISSRVKGKYVSPVPFGSLFMAAFLLLEGYRHIALLGLLDPVPALLACSVITEHLPQKKD